MALTRRFKVKEHQLYTVLPRIWNELKRDNEIDRIYRPRARKIDFFSTLFAPGFFLQRILFSKRLRKISLGEQPPIFILGLWRSGTTHLHYLLAENTRYGYLTNHQAFTLNFSLLSLDRLNRILSIFVPGKRPQDNVRVRLDDPAEEEQALSTMTTRSSIHSFFFPKNQTYFKKYHLFEGISQKEKSKWQRDYMYLLKNIAFYSRKRRLLLKNPHNTGRIKELLEIFPDAKFIFIHRDPYTVFRSTKKLYNRMINSQFLQFYSQGEIEKSILENNASILRKYVTERALIPEGNLVEVGFDELERKPLETVGSIYEELHLEGYTESVPAMTQYLEEVKQYKRNRYRPLSGRILKRIHTEWDFWFEEFGYMQRSV